MNIVGAETLHVRLKNLQKHPSFHIFLLFAWLILVFFKIFFILVTSFLTWNKKIHISKISDF